MAQTCRDAGLEYIWLGWTKTAVRLRSGKERRAILCLKLLFVAVSDNKSSLILSRHQSLGFVVVAVFNFNCSLSFERYHGLISVRVYCLSSQSDYHHHRHHQSLNREGRWGTTDDFATSFLHFSLFSTALWDLPNSRPVHSLTSSHATCQGTFGHNRLSSLSRCELIVA